MATQFSNLDQTGAPQRVSIHWEHVQPEDCDNPRPDENDCGFWPSRDPKAAGYVGRVSAAKFEEMHNAAKERLAAWERGEWAYIGNVARAHIRIPIGGNSFRLLTVDSGGLWGTESDSDSAYHRSIFEQEKAGLMAELKRLGAAIVAGDFDESETH